ncbi:MazG nucleotide pyrophosphohydrolase domain-containing protein [Dietzia psychralcaliphila]|uniref:MazG nucleotide pyrophosphohydrolase domain-containing protein n=1 Tax=Dietzia psychralcaliphila TaxID=139021 RepID=UPI0027E1479A|nr:MazG nucleotide pyrophosphohydrolase domain-containing protein [Dietzia psychralcaliphila]
MSETLFSTGAGDRLGGDRLAEAVEVMARIRRDGDWESAQTHASLLPYLLEESWELVDAVADGDRDELVSELGDLLLQVLFHAAIGAERAEGSFDIQDVAAALLDKLRRRAPYWFTADGAAGVGSAHLDAAEQDRLWQVAKAAERAGCPPRGVVDGIPWDMPALALGQKVLARASSAGVPDELVPAQMRVVRVDPVGLFREHVAGGRDDGSGREDCSGGENDSGREDSPGGGDASGREDGSGRENGSGREDGTGSGSAEVAYRQVVRSFARDLREAESRLPVPATDATAADWRAAWPS